MAMWVGSIVALAAAIVLGLGSSTGTDRILLVGAGVVYMGGVQLPTFMINIPLNNGVQALDIDSLDAGALQ